MSYSHTKNTSIQGFPCRSVCHLSRLIFNAEILALYLSWEYTVQWISYTADWIFSFGPSRLPLQAWLRSGEEGGRWQSMQVNILQWRRKKQFNWILSALRVERQTYFTHSGQSKTTQTPLRCVWFPALADPQVIYCHWNVSCSTSGPPWLWHCPDRINDVVWAQTLPTGSAAPPLGCDKMMIYSELGALLLQDVLFQVWKPVF